MQDQKYKTKPFLRKEEKTQNEATVLLAGFAKQTQAFISGGVLRNEPILQKDGKTQNEAIFAKGGKWRNKAIFSSLGRLASFGKPAL